MNEPLPSPRCVNGGLPWVSVEPFDGSQLPQWEAGLRQLGPASTFQNSVWMDVLRSAYGFRPCPLHFRQSGQIVASLPMVEVVSWLTGRRGVSLPFADECPPLVPSGEPTPELLEAMVNFGQSQKWEFFEIRGTSPAMRPRVPSVSFYGHLIDFNESREQLWQGLKSPVRTAIRKAEASGLEIEFSTDLSALREFHALYRHSRQRHGLPPQPFSFFETIHRRILADGGGLIGLARLGRRCIAGAVFFQTGRQVLFKYGAFDTRFQKLRANNLIFWNALQRFQQLGCTSMNMGRTSLANEGLRRFKQGWASREYTIDYAKYDLRKNEFVREKDMAGGWYNWAFRLAPRWMSSLVGKVLYKHWA